MTHSREHDVLLAALLAGDVLESDPRAREQLSRCPACAQTWKEARIEMDSLKSAARRAQRAQEAAERGGPVPGEERAMEFLRAELARRMPGTAPGDRLPEDVHGRAQPQPSDGKAHAGGTRDTRGADTTRDAQTARMPQPGRDAQGPRTPPPDRDIDDGSSASAPRRTRPRTWPWMALAAALMAIGVVSYLLRPAPDRSHDLLGTNSVRTVSLERVEGGSLRFTWSGTPRPGCQPFAEVEGRDTSGASWTAVWPAPIAQQVTNPLLRDAALPAAGWIVPAAVVTGWPKEIRWRVVPHDASGPLNTDASEWSPPFSLR